MTTDQRTLPSPTAAVAAADRFLANPAYRRGAAMTGLGVLGLAATDSDGLVLCPFRRCTGGYCPGCGATRATGALLRGDLSTSWHHHPIVIIGVAQALVWLAILVVLEPARRARLKRFTNPLLLGNLAIVLTIWIARLATGAIPTPFGL